MRRTRVASPRRCAHGESSARRTIPPIATGDRRRACTRSSDSASASETETTQEVAVARRAGGWRTEARKDILFDDDPAVVVLEPERVAHVREGYHAVSELAEDAATDGGVIVPLFRASALRALVRAVLEVDVPDARGVLRDRDQRVAATEHAVAGVEAQAKQRRIGPRHQGVDFLWRFHIPGAVMMEHGAQPGFVANGGGDRRRTRGEAVPLIGGEAVGGGDAAGSRRAMRNGRVVVGEDDEGVAKSGIAEEACRLYGSVAAIRLRIGACERDRHEGAGEREAAASDFVGQRVRFRRQKTP